MCQGSNKNGTVLLNSAQQNRKEEQEQEPIGDTMSMAAKLLHYYGNKMEHGAQPQMACIWTTWRENNRQLDAA